MKKILSLILIVASLPAQAEGKRYLNAHQHGVSAMNIAFEGTAVVIELQAPGADIVGFEYAAKSSDDLFAIDAAITTLGTPLELFVLPSAASCTLIDAEVEMASDGALDRQTHGQHDDGPHAKDGHRHSEHEEHTGEANHTAFHAKYSLTCDNSGALNLINFAYFDAFPNAMKIEVQAIMASGAKAFEVKRDAPVLNIGQ